MGGRGGRKYLLVARNVKFQVTCNASYTVWRWCERCGSLGTQSQLLCLTAACPSAKSPAQTPRWGRKSWIKCGRNACSVARFYSSACAAKVPNEWTVGVACVNKPANSRG